MRNIYLLILPTDERTTTQHYNHLPMEKITTEVLNIFYPAFIRAVLDCCAEGYPVRIIHEEKTELNSQLITVEGKKAIDFYYLGKYFATYRSEM